jgi:NDP-sugar pyrophosphorylase family protein
MMSRTDVHYLETARVAAAEDGPKTKTVILAGGKGTRLRPYTSVLPKPLMPIGDRAILEVVIRQLARQGFVDITLSVGHLAHVIEAVFGNGSGHDVELTYVREDQPLGTAGSLRLIEGLDDAFLMLNGDLVTTFDFREMQRMHRASGNLLTIATKRRRVDVNYGVLGVQRATGSTGRVVSYTEKPPLDLVVSTGIYVLEPAVLNFLPAEGYVDFPELVQILLRANAPVGAFEHDGLWLDIGRQDDYDRAITMLEEGELAALDPEFGLWDTPVRVDEESTLGQSASGAGR